jgi:hypothetical protein
MNDLPGTNHGTAETDSHQKKGCALELLNAAFVF